MTTVGTDPAVEIAARAMYTQDQQDSMSSGEWDAEDEHERDAWRRIARAGLAALRDAKRLLPENVNAVVVATTAAAAGFTEHIEWGVTYPNLHPTPVMVHDGHMARHTAAAGEGRVAVRRTVYTGPWEEAVDA